MNDLPSKNDVPQKKTVQVKRAYDPPSANDGVRVLVDRLWPRGLSKTKAAIDLWLKDIAPSDHLRRQLGQLPDRLAQLDARDTGHRAKRPPETLVQSRSVAMERVRDAIQRGARSKAGRRERAGWCGAARARDAAVRRARLASQQRSGASHVPHGTRVEIQILSFGCGAFASFS